jgi:DNA-binding beta-propeller fold protein YncE
MQWRLRIYFKWIVNSELGVEVSLLKRNKSFNKLVVTLFTAVGCMSLSLASVLAGPPKLTPVKDYIPADATAVERRGVCLSSDEKTVYLTGLQDRAIYAFNVQSGEMTYATSLADINPNAYGKAVAVGPDGDIWAPACSSLEVYRFSKYLDYKATYSLEDLGANVVEGILVGKGNELFVPDRQGEGGVYKAVCNGDTAKLDLTFGKGGHADGGAEVRQPALGPDGSVYSGDYKGTTVYKIDGKTGNSTVFSSKVPSPYHITVDGSGRVYVAQYDGPTAVTILGSDGSVLGAFTGAELGLEERAAGIAVSADGSRLFVVDQKSADNGGIVKSYSVAF